MQVTKLGFIGLNAVNFDEMRHYYGQTMGLPESATAPGSAHYALGPDHHAVSLTQSHTNGINHMGLELAPGIDLIDVQKRLAESGVKADLQSDPMPGLGKALRFADPDGAVIYLYSEMTRSVKAWPVSGTRPRKLGHVAYYVESAKRSEAFYTQTMGFRWSDWIEDLFVFMRCNKDHHSVNFITAPDRGMFHFAFELKDANHIVDVADELARVGHKLLWGPGRHGAGHNLFIYHHDPDGNVVEYYAELDQMLDEAAGHYDPRPWHKDAPQRPKVWQRSPEARNEWGILPLEAFGPKALNLHLKA